MITRLEWDKLRKIGSKPLASKFLLKAKLRSEGFSRHNRQCLSVSSIKGESGDAYTMSDDDGPDGGDNTATAREEKPKKSTVVKKKATKQRAPVMKKKKK